MSAASPADDGETTGGAFRVDYGIGEEQDSAGSGESQGVEQNPGKAPSRSPRLRDPADEEVFSVLSLAAEQPGSLAAELLVLIAAHLGIKDLGRLGCVCKTFVATVEAAAKLTLDAKLQAERDRFPREPGEPSLRLLWRISLPLRALWGAHSAAHYDVGEGGATLTATVENNGRVALGDAPMQVGGGGAGAVHYVEIEFLELCDQALVGHSIGVGRPGLDVGRENAEGGVWTPGFWGVDTDDALLDHADQRIDWAGYQFLLFRQGDTLGLLLDGGAGTLAVYKKGTPSDAHGRWDKDWDSSGEDMMRLGVAARGLTGELCWAATLADVGDIVRITAKPPPRGWCVDAGLVEAHELAAVRNAENAGLCM